MKTFRKPFFLLFIIFLAGCSVQDIPGETSIRNKQMNALGEAVEQTTPESPQVSLIAVGDIMLSRNVAKKMKAHGMGYPFEKMSPFLRDADITFGNLENPINAGRPIETGEMVFHGDPGAEFALSDAGFDIVSLANNHTPNFGEKGLLDTFTFLKNAGIEYVGAGETIARAHAPVFLEKNGITLAFLAYNDDDVVPPSYEAGETRPGTAFMRKERMMQAVKEAKEQADIVIVSMHSGTEYIDHANVSQIAFAHAAIDAGAELVIGHHPHVIQPVEQYKGKFILYSLGNFIFDQMWSEETRRGMAVKILLEKQGVKKLSFYPVLIFDYAQPDFATGTAAQSSMLRLQYPLEEQNGVPSIYVTTTQE